MGIQVQLSSSQQSLSFLTQIVALAFIRLVLGVKEEFKGVLGPELYFLLGVNKVLTG